MNEAGGDGLLYGNPKQLCIQLIAVLVTLVLGFVVTTIILKVLDGLMGLRVSDEDEMAGLDLSQHSETAYALGGAPTASTRQTGGSGGALRARPCAPTRGDVLAGATSRPGGGLTRRPSARALVLRRPAGRVCPAGSRS